MKKQLGRMVTAFLLTAAMALLLCSCGDRSGSLKNSGTDPQQEQLQTIPDSAEETVPDNTEETLPAGTTEAESVAEPEGVPVLTNRDVFDLWTTANTIYAKWLVLPESDIVDLNDYVEPQKVVGVHAYRVREESIQSMDALEAYLSGYFEKDAYEQYFNDYRFVEKDGALYIVGGGIGGDFFEVKHVSLKEQQEDTAVIEVSGYDTLGQETTSADYHLIYRDGQWRFTGFFLCHYDSFDYSGVTY